jgi:ribosomal subunit interface protein
MIKTDLTARSYVADEKLRRYIEDKLSGLEKYLPRHARQTAHLEVVLIDDPNGREDNRYVCDTLLTLPGQNLQSSEGAVNMYASVDIVAAKLRSQLRTYKAKHTSEPRRLKMLTRWMGRTSETDPATPTAADGLE